ncbi:hypothetical protein ABZ883_26295 [Streptomyces sp. NPDC046977]|uniref:hypothetical protein n=1 Tax=Streptomyces sp. NPDC046977 TaxID=3154703 RepID=UPI00340A396D
MRNSIVSPQAAGTQPTQDQSSTTPHRVELEQAPLDPGRKVVFRIFKGRTRAAFDPAQVTEFLAHQMLRQELAARDINDVEIVTPKARPEGGISKTEALDIFARRLAGQKNDAILTDAARVVAIGADAQGMPEQAKKIRAALKLNARSREQVALLLDLRNEYADRPAPVAFVDQWIDLVIASNDPDVVLEQVLAVLAGTAGARP